jgi:hypothetical protein
MHEEKEGDVEVDEYMRELEESVQIQDSTHPEIRKMENLLFNDV